MNIIRNKTLKRRARVELRPHSVLRSKKDDVDIRPGFDADKNYFLKEFLKLLAYAENYQKVKQFVGFYNTGLMLAYFCIQIQHYSLANKVYSLFGQILLVAKKGDLAVKMYTKLRHCAHTDRDSMTKMFAYK